MLQIVGNNLFFCKQILQLPFYTDLTTQIPLPRFLDDSTPQMIPITIFHNDCEKFTIIFPPIFGLRFGRHQFAHDDLWWLLPPNEVLRSRGCFGAPWKLNHQAITPPLYPSPTRLYLKMSQFFNFMRPSKIFTNIRFPNFASWKKCPPKENDRYECDRQEEICLVIDVLEFPR